MNMNKPNVRKLFLCFIFIRTILVRNNAKSKTLIFIQSYCLHLEMSRKTVQVLFINIEMVRLGPMTSNSALMNADCVIS